MLALASSMRHSAHLPSGEIVPGRHLLLHVGQSIKALIMPPLERRGRILYGEYQKVSQGLYHLLRFELCNLQSVLSQRGLNTLRLRHDQGLRKYKDFGSSYFVHNQEYKPLLRAYYRSRDRG